MSSVGVNWNVLKSTPRWSGPDKAGLGIGLGPTTRRILFLLLIAFAFLGLFETFECSNLTGNYHDHNCQNMRV